MLFWGHYWSSPGLSTNFIYILRSKDEIQCDKKKFKIRHRINNRERTNCDAIMWIILLSIAQNFVQIYNAKDVAKTIFKEQVMENSKHPERLKAIAYHLQKLNFIFYH